MTTPFMDVEAALALRRELAVGGEARIVSNDPLETPRTVGIRRSCAAAAPEDLERHPRSGGATRGSVKDRPRLDVRRAERGEISGRHAIEGPAATRERSR